MSEKRLFVPPARKDLARGVKDLALLHNPPIPWLRLYNAVTSTFRDAELKEVDLAHVHGGERDTADAQGDEERVLYDNHPVCAGFLESCPTGG